MSAESRDLLVFVILTLGLAGGCTLMAGRAIALLWAPFWRVIPAALALGLGNRFLCYALFGQPLTDPVLYLRDSLPLVLLALLAYRLTRVGQMLRQYDWLYERKGWFGWQDKATLSPNSSNPPGEQPHASR